MAQQIYKFDGTTWKSRGRPDILPPDVIPGFTLVAEDQFATLDTSRWYPYDPIDNNSTFGAPTRIQVYHLENLVVGNASAGATNNTSLKMKSLETDAGFGTLPDLSSAGTRYSYTAGMLDSKSTGTYYPRYPRFEWRIKSPHGQGLWPALWLTAKGNGVIVGATMCEYDIFEYFHGGTPGKNSISIHGTDNTGQFHSNRYTNNGSPQNGGGPVRTFFEVPTYTPAWHIWTAEIVPVTDATGTTLADPTQPSNFVRLTVYLDGVQVWQIVDTSALFYTTNGGTEDSFWNVYMQGCQIDGNFIGHPRSPLGYSHWTGNCLITGGGTPPNACLTVSSSGYSVQAPHFDDPASTLEIDYFKCWKYTG